MSNFYSPRPTQLEDSNGNLISPAQESGGHLAAIDTATGASKTDLDTIAGAVVGGKVQTASAPSFGTRSDTYTTAVAGVIVDVHTAPVNEFAILVVGTGAVATSWTVVLEGSLDGVKFTPILTHTNTSPGDSLQMFTGGLKSPSLYFRSHVTALVLGSATNIVVTVLGV